MSLREKLDNIEEAATVGKPTIDTIGTTDDGPGEFADPTAMKKLTKNAVDNYKARARAVGGGGGTPLTGTDDETPTTNWGKYFNLKNAGYASAATAAGIGAVLLAKKLRAKKKAADKKKAAAAKA